MEVEFFTEPSLPVARVPLRMSWTMDFPSSRGRLIWPRAAVYEEGMEVSCVFIRMEEVNWENRKVVMCGGR